MLVTFDRRFFRREPKILVANRRGNFSRGRDWHVKRFYFIRVAEKPDQRRPSQKRVRVTAALDRSTPGDVISYVVYLSTMKWK